MQSATVVQASDGGTGVGVGAGVGVATGIGVAAGWRDGASSAGRRPAHASSDASDTTSAIATGHRQLVVNAPRRISSH